MSVKALERPEAEVSASEFQSLEEKIYRTIDLLKVAREAKTNAERDASRLRAQLEEREEENDQLRSQMVSLRKEREDVRTRVEKMLKQIDALTQAESEG
jgi:chromosome segregation ATPase